MSLKKEEEEEEECTLYSLVEYNIVPNEGMTSLRTFFLKCHTLSPKGYIIQNRYVPYPN
jgi:hypothetical protein